MGVIDTLSAGFELVRKRLWLILLPVLLDIGLWVTPRLSVQTMVAGLLRQLETQLAGNAGMPQSLPESLQMLRDGLSRLNLLGLVSSVVPGVPGLVVRETTPFFGWAQRTIELDFGLGFLGIVAGLLVAGLLVDTVYLAMVAQQARDGENDWVALLRRLPRYWLQLLGAGLLLTALLMLIGLPLYLLASIFFLFNPAVGLMVWAVSSYISFWILVYMSFVPSAILLNEDGPLRAIWHSFSVVRSNFWPTLGLLLLVYVIELGFGFILERLTVTAPGAIAAIAVNAFIGSGLTAAVFIFYRDRYRAWRSAVERNRSLAKS